jgi:hypothetical protein
MLIFFVSLSIKILRKEVKMHKKTSWAKRSPLELAMEKILLARRERGADAQGDLLLQAALKAIRSKHVGSTQKNLKDYLLLTQNLTPYQRSLVEDACSLAKRGLLAGCANLLLRFFPLLIELFLRLKSKKSLGCRRSQEGSLAYYKRQEGHWILLISIRSNSLNW